ncbi:probable serine/threonine-protein kinase MARK-A [Aphidius gifuensis]|uniref:probable serine/threonine-protein kinase MARK-A n=1 Tax=Aphidius gifuensis TaxID=684658 RepID=UPI001CDB8144|nr:probable serine/threonine-protein kinase MARK-A [Aphidius gifuensis]
MTSSHEDIATTITTTTTTTTNNVIQNQMDNVYESMDTSESNNIDTLTVSNINQQMTNDSQPIDPDGFIINDDVPYVNNVSRSLIQSDDDINHNTNTNQVQLNDALSLERMNNNVTFNSVDINNDIIPITNCNQSIGELNIPTTSQTKIPCNIKIPIEGTKVSPKIIKKAGPYILGPLIGTSPVQSIVQCLAKKTDTNKFYTIKILTLKDNNEYETQDDRQGKMLLHAEYSLLSLLKNQNGVVQHHGFFKDCALSEKTLSNGKRIYTGKLKKRLCLVLDCLTSHDYNPINSDLLNLQHHVIREKKLCEKESLLIFIDTIKIIAELHKKNIVHRDIKLGNLILNRKTRKVTITNFCLGKYLSSENDLLKDQRGSPAYISPDVLCGKPYLGKPSDMWACGVVLFTMLYGQFPFYDSNPTQLFIRIKAANFFIPNDGRVSNGTINLIRNLLVLQPNQRLTAIQVLDSLSTIIGTLKIPKIIGEEEQVVPDINDIENNKSKNNNSSSSNSQGYKSFETRPLSDFIKHNSTQFQQQDKNNQKINNNNNHHLQTPSPLVSRGRPYRQIPVYRIDTDPRELTQVELERYEHLIPRDNSSARQHINNSQSSTVRRDGIAGRTRTTASTASRYHRPVQSNPTTTTTTTAQDSSQQQQQQQHAVSRIIQNPIDSVQMINNSSLNLDYPLVWNNIPSNNDSINPAEIINQNLTTTASDLPAPLVSDSFIGIINPSNSASQSLNSSNVNQLGDRQTRNLVRDIAIQSSIERFDNSIRQNSSSSSSSSSLASTRATRISQMRSREQHARMVSMALRACLTNQNNNQRTTNDTGTSPIVGISNRSVPDIETRNNQSRFREVMVDRLISLRVRMQQNRIDNIEREMNARNNFISTLNTNNNNIRRSTPPRRSTIGTNRHTPYSSHLRYSIRPNHNVTIDSSTSQINAIQRNTNQTTTTTTPTTTDRSSPISFENALQRLANRLRTSSQAPTSRRPPPTTNESNDSSNSSNQRHLN